MKILFSWEILTLMSTILLWVFSVNRTTFKSLIKDPTCFKNPENPSCIDLILTNSPYSFQNSCVIETGLSDFHKMTVSVMKTTFQKLKPKIVNYRDYSGFSSDFGKNLLHNLSLEIINTNSNALKNFSRYVSKLLIKWHQ